MSHDLQATYDLPNHFWKMPKIATTKVTTKQWKALMLNRGNQMFAQGETWDIKRKSMGSGVYEVYLEEPAAEKLDTLTRTKQALNYMINEYEKASGIDRKQLPAFVTSMVK